MRKVNIKEGDRVGYRVAFLRSIGETHGEMARARGTVTSIEKMSKFSTTELARVDWDSGDWPGRVNVQNLARVGSLAFTSEDK